MCTVPCPPQTVCETASLFLCPFHCQIRKRADIALAFITGTTITLDVRTTNTQSASAHGAASAEAHLRSQEREMAAKYAGYYRNFVHFVIDLGGAVNEDSYGALKEITREAANAAGPRLRWEKFD